MTDIGQASLVGAMLADGHGDRKIAEFLGITRHRARGLIGAAKLAAVGPTLKAGEPLALYESARRALAAAVTTDEVLQVHDATEWIKLYARQAKDRELMANATVLRARAERRLGEMLAAEKAAGHLATGRPKNGSGAEPFRVTLEQAGIDKKLSMRAQAAAAVPQSDFEAGVSRMRESIAAGSAKVIDPAKPDQAKRRESRLAEMRDLAANPLLLPQGPFAAGIADPPWEDPDAPIGQTGRHYRDHYPTMTPAQIAHFHDADGRTPAVIFADRAFLALWVTDHVLLNGQHLPVLAAWGFAPGSIVVWDKVVIGMGQGFVRNQTEHIVLAHRGNVPAPAADVRIRSLFREQRTGTHSQKPVAVYDWLESWFPDMAYVELFARSDSARSGWATWGNQAPKTEATE